MKINILSKLPINGYRLFLLWVLSSLRTVSYVNSCWLHGSRVAGTHNKYSDLDIAFVVNCETDKKKLNKLLETKLYHREFLDYFNDRIFNYWRFRGREVGVHVYTSTELTEKVNLFTSGFSSFNKLQCPVQHIIVDSFVFFDKDNFFSLQREKCIAFINTCCREFINNYLNRLRQEAEWWVIRGRWRSVFEEMNQVNIFLAEVAKCHYLLNGKLSMNSSKHYQDDLLVLKPDLNKEVIRLVSINPHDLDCKSKIKLMGIIYKKLLVYSKSL